MSKDYKQIKVQSDFVKASKPLWLEKKPEGEFVNEDTYQTLKDFRVDSVTPVDKNQKPYSIFVGTPCHSEVSLHYVQALLKFSQMCYAQKVHFEVQIMKSSLVTQGRNLCVSGFLASKCSHLLFIDSDIHFNPAYTTLNILAGTASSSDIITRIIPQITAAILAALTVSLLS